MKQLLHHPSPRSYNVRCQIGKQITGWKSTWKATVDKGYLSSYCTQPKVNALSPQPKGHAMKEKPINPLDARRILKFKARNQYSPRCGLFWGATVLSIKVSLQATEKIHLTVRKTDLLLLVESDRSPIRIHRVCSACVRGYHSGFG